MSSSDIDESLEEEENYVSDKDNKDEARVLTFKEAGQCLDVLGKDQSGLRYAYLLMAPVSRNLVDISVITEFKHILYVDLSKNKLTTQSIQCLAQLPFLLSLQCDSNFIDSGVIGVLKYLQIFTLNSNMIESPAGIQQPQLERLELSHNKITNITELNERQVPNLKTLEVCYNNIKILSTINFTSLDSLFLAYNRIKRIIDLSKLVNLRILHLRGNIITRLRGFSSKMKKLQYINLRDNLIHKITRFQKLRCLPKLDTLIFLNNPIVRQQDDMDEIDETDEDETSQNYRIQLLRILPNLKRINKNVVTPEERERVTEYEQELGEEFVEFEESIEPSTPIEFGSLISIFEGEMESEFDILDENK